MGSRRKYHHEVVAPNSRLDTVHAAVLGVKLPRLDGWNERRALAARRSGDALASIPGVVAPVVLPTTRTHAWHLYVVRLETADRDAVLASLQAEGIGAGVHYPVPVHLQPAHRSLGKGPGSFPVAERLARRILSLPLYPELTGELQARVIDALGRALARAPRAADP